MSTKVFWKFRKVTNKESTILTFVAALIVFVTYMTKEGLSEHWKNQADAMDTAEYFFSVSRASDETFLSLQDIYRMQTQTDQGVGRLLRLQRSLGSPPKHISVEAGEVLDSHMVLEIGYGRNRAQSADLNTLKILVDNLPEQDKNRSMLEEVSKLVAQDKTIIASNEKILYPADDLSRDDMSDNAQKIRSDVVAAFLKAHLANRSFQKDISQRIESLIADVLKDADDTRKSNKRRSGIAWWFSSIFFAAGWGLGLFARLSGTKVD